MSFILTKTLDSAISYPGLGITDSTNVEAKTVDIIYEVVQLDSINNGMARVVFTTKIGDSEKRFDFFEFEYTSSNNPIEEAESVLKLSLE